MTEPLYEYVKGKGWVVVVKTVKSVLATMNCGTEVRIEARPPNMGELFLRAGNFDEEGGPDLEKFIYWLRTGYRNLHELKASRTLDHTREWILEDKYTTLVTVVPL